MYLRGKKFKDSRHSKLAAGAVPEQRIEKLPDRWAHALDKGEAYVVDWICIFIKLIFYMKRKAFT